MTATDQWLRFETTADDIRRFAAFAHRHRRRRQTSTGLGKLALWTLLVLLGVLVAAAAVVTVLTGSLSWTTAWTEDPIVHVLVVVLCATWLLYAASRIALPHLAVWSAKRSPGALGPRRLRLSDKGVEVKSKHLHSQIPWSKLESCEETVHAFYLLVGREQGLVVPLRAFDDPADAAGFRKAIARHFGREKAS